MGVCRLTTLLILGAPLAESSFRRLCAQQPNETSTKNVAGCRACAADLDAYGGSFAGEARGADRKGVYLAAEVATRTSRAPRCRLLSSSLRRSWRLASTAASSFMPAMPTPMTYGGQPAPLGFEHRVKHGEADAGEVALGAEDASGSL